MTLIRLKQFSEAMSGTRMFKTKDVLLMIRSSLSADTPVFVKDSGVVYYSFSKQTA